MKDADTWPQLSGLIFKHLASVMIFKIRFKQRGRWRMQKLSLSSVAQPTVTQAS